MADAALQTIRKTYPQYNDLPDHVLVERLDARLPGWRGASGPAPATVGPAAVAAPTAPRDVIGRAKAALVAEPPAGDPRQNPLARGIRTAGRLVIPGSLEELVEQAVLQVPGKGVLASAGRAGGAGAAGAGISAAKGEDWTQGALRGLGIGILGEGLGGLARAAARTGQAVLSKTTEKVGTLIGDFIPAFKGPTARDTLARVISGEGQKALSKEYATAVEGLIKRHGDPAVVVPALARLGRPGPNKDLPGLMSASEAMTTIQSLRRSLSGVTGNLSRRKAALEEIQFLDQAEAQLGLELSRHLPPEAQKQLAEAAKNYARGKAIQRWFGVGRERLTEGQVKRLINAGALNEPALERAFLLRQGELKEMLGAKEFAALMDAVRRGETNPLAVSIPGKAPSASWHFGFVPTVKPPHAPVRVGRPEAVAEAASRAGRAVGARVVGEATEE